MPRGCGDRSAGRAGAWEERVMANPVLPVGVRPWPKRHEEICIEGVGLDGGKKHRRWNGNRFESYQAASDGSRLLV